MSLKLKFEHGGIAIDACLNMEAFKQMDRDGDMTVLYPELTNLPGVHGRDARNPYFLTPLFSYAHENGTPLEIDYVAELAAGKGGTLSIISSGVITGARLFTGTFACIDKNYQEKWTKAYLKENMVGYDPNCVFEQSKVSITYSEGQGKDKFYTGHFKPDVIASKGELFAFKFIIEFEYDEGTRYGIYDPLVRISSE